MLPIMVLVWPASSSALITISGKNTPDGALVAVRPSTATLTTPAGILSSVKLPLASV